MSAPRRLVEDPTVDPALKRALGQGSGLRALDELTRRRLRAGLARAAALPAVAAWWIFGKSALAALGVVGVAATAATVTGVVEWRSAQPVGAPVPTVSGPRGPQSMPRPAVPEPVMIELRAPVDPPPKLDRAAALPEPRPGASAPATLAAESTLLEQARREMRRAPKLALQIADEHAERYPRGQLASERTLLQVEALHRLGRDPEARLLAERLLRGSSGELYRERTRQLLGEGAAN